MSPTTTVDFPSRMEEQFDAFFMNVAQQCSELSRAENGTTTAIDVMHDAYFGFLRRKTDFFTGDAFETDGKTSVLKAMERHRREVEKNKTRKEKEQDEERRKRKVEMERKKEKEEAMKTKRMEEEKERKERVREALMKQKMEESKKKIVEVDDDGNEVVEDEDEAAKIARENKEKVEKEL